MKNLTIPADGGGMYAETDLSKLIAEPYNAVSAFIFLAIAVFWGVKLRAGYRQHRFLAVSTVLLTIGAIGGTLYHALRISRIFLVMDWLPILLLCVMAGMYFLVQTTGRWWHALLPPVSFIAIQLLLWRLMPQPYRPVLINVNYALMALMVLLPLLMFLTRRQFRNYEYVLLSLLSFSLALLCRIYDRDHWLPMGTHFLWHCFGAVACHQMFVFIYKSGAAVKAR